MWEDIDLRCEAMIKTCGKFIATGTIVLDQEAFMMTTRYVIMTPVIYITVVNDAANCPRYITTTQQYFNPVSKVSTSLLMTIGTNLVKL